MPVTKKPSHPAKSRTGEDIQVPVLWSAVGGDGSPAFKRAYPDANRPGDIRTVWPMLWRLHEANYKINGGSAFDIGMWAWAPPPSPPSVPLLSKAIGQFQKVEQITAGREIYSGCIPPRSQTLVRLAELDDQLQTMARVWRAQTKNYMFRGFINRKGFEDRCGKLLKGPHGAARREHLYQFLGFMENDPEILDIRWMAYILATVYVEAWAEWAPIDERDKGGAHKDSYGETFKVRREAGGVHLTGERGRQFLGRKDGTSEELHGKFGTAAAAYAGDQGAPQVYFGRGYVQLTHWQNYLTAGAELGRGVDFVLNPDLVKEPAVSYRIMAASMRTGKAFANNQTFRKYLNDKTDYRNARRMVNGVDRADDIAALAKFFEDVLIHSATSFQPVG